MFLRELYPNVTKTKIIPKYARRWLIEKAISEKIECFHCNRVSSWMVIKIDFDMVMSLLAYNLYRQIACQLEGFTHDATTLTLFQKSLPTKPK